MQKRRPDGGQTQGAGHGSTWPETWVEGWAAEGNEAGRAGCTWPGVEVHGCCGPWSHSGSLWKRGQTGAGSPVRRRLALSRALLGRGGLNPASGDGEEEGMSSGDLHQGVAPASLTPLKKCGN